MTGIVIGVDGSEGAGRALQWAVEEGEVHDWPVTAVMAWGLLDQRVIGDGEFDPGYDAADAERALDSYIADALGPSKAATVRRRAVIDLAPRALLDAAADASLLVVGARGLGDVRGLLLGSVSQQCLHHSPCPIAIVGPDGPTVGGESPARVVVGVDGSATARRALEWAVEEARCRRASLEVVQAWHMPYLVGLPYVGVSFDPRGIEEEARAMLEASIASVDTTGLAAPIEPVLVNDGAATAILDTAKGADLVVVGSRGRGGFAGLLLGSVSSRVAQEATCPVVVVRPEN